MNRRRIRTAPQSSINRDPREDNNLRKITSFVIGRQREDSLTDESEEEEDVRQILFSSGAQGKKAIVARSSERPNFPPLSHLPELSYLSEGKEHERGRKKSPNRNKIIPSSERRGLISREASWRRSTDKDKMEDPSRIELNVGEQDEDRYKWFDKAKRMGAETGRKLIEKAVSKADDVVKQRKPRRRSLEISPSRSFSSQFSPFRSATYEETKQFPSPFASPSSRRAFTINGSEGTIEPVSEEQKKRLKRSSLQPPRLTSKQSSMLQIGWGQPKERKEESWCPRSGADMIETLTQSPSETLRGEFNLLSQQILV